MAQAKKAQPSYEALSTELDAILAALQREDNNVDVAITQYQRGLELINELEAYLKTAENKITELKAKFNNSQA